MRHGEVVTHHLGHPPDRAELVHVHRPLEELPGIVESARRIGAHAIWFQSGLNAGGQPHPAGCWMAPDDAARARRIVESAGMAFVCEPSIVETLAKS